MADVTFLSSVPWWSSMMSGWEGILILCLGSGLTFFLIAHKLLRKPTREELRLERIRPEATADQGPSRGMFGPWTQALAAQIPESEKERQEFELLLRQAGLYGPHVSESIFALRFLLLLGPVVAAGICAIFAEESRTVPILLIGGLLAGVLAVLPRIYVFLRRRRRMRRIREALPDTLDMLSMCVSGGLELGESLDHVARRLTGYPECAQELMLLKRHAELGSLRQALLDFSKRVDLPETNQLAGLLLRGSYLGTELVGSLAQQAEHLRVVRKQSAAIQANKTPIKLIIPIIFCFAPAALILLTAPAVVQLRDFLTGRTFADRLNPNRSAAHTAAPAEAGFGTQTIMEALSALDEQRASTAEKRYE
ncbi:MAG: type II secretion system F family protein [Pirellulales bacterium]|nr:type II secretion system F family protein [Pirellulales bacterium]